MNNQDKTKDELIKELQKLQLDYDSLKVSYEKEITKRKLAEEALKFTRFSLDNATDTMAIIDYNGRFIDVNNAFCRSVGYSREQLLSMTVHDIDPFYPAATWSVFWEKLKQAGSLTFESVHRTKEEKLIPVEINVNFFEYKGKEYHCGFARDITERKRAEEALRESEEKWRKLVTTIPDYIALHDINGRYIFLNHYAEGFSEKGVIGKSLYDFIAGDSIEDYRRNFDTCVKSKQTQRFIYSAFGDNSVLRIYENYLVPIIEKDQIINVMAIATDITERKQTEAALHLEKENFRHSLDDSPLGVRIATIEGDTIYANKALLDFYGYDSLGELQRTPLKDRYTRESYIQAQKRKRQRERGDLGATNYEISIVRKNGEIRHLQVFRKEVLWYGVRQFQVICNDITERKQAEKEIRKSKKLLEDLHKHLNEILENERALISREIHDQIGQSLTALKLDLNWMDKYIKEINPEAAAKLQDMIELVTGTIKDVQRISSDLRPGILDDLGLAAAIEWYCDEFEKRTGIRCSVTLDDSIFGDPQKNLIFFRVLQEALTNVIRHANASSVTIKLHHTQKGITLAIMDNGIGITREKVESAKSLGLIGIRERIRQFGGKVGISSEKGQGTKLTVFIPQKEKTML
jgi:PAS domain S-box-containing protein